MDKPKPKLFTVQDAALFLGVNPDTIRRWAIATKLIGMKVGSRGDWRFTQDELLRLVKTNSQIKLPKKTYAAIRKFLTDNANVLQKLATRKHKELLKTGNLRSEFLSKYQKYHIKIFKLLAAHIDDKEKGLPVFKKFGDDFAKEAVNDGLSIEDAVDGSIFLKEAVWEKLEESGLLNDLTAYELNHLSKIMAAYIDVLSSRLAFTYHNYHTDQLEKDKENAKKTKDRIYKIFMEAPIPIAILKGSHHVYELSNPLNNMAIGVDNPVGKSVKELFPHAKDIHKLLDVTYQTGKPFYATEYPFTLNIPGEGTKTIYVNATYQPLIDENGNIEGVMTTGVDVTQQVLARKMAENNEKELQLITDAVPVLISYVDEKERYQFNNKGYEDWFGHSREEVKGKHLKDVLGKEAYTAIRPHVKQALAGKKVAYEALAPYKDGGHRYILATYVPHPEKKGFYALVSDITERHKLEQSKDDFIAISSHELKTPVTSLKMFTQILDKRLQQGKTEQAAKILQQINGQINRLTNLVTELLDVSRIEKGKLPYNMEEFSIDDLVEEVTSSMQTIIQTHTIVLEGKARRTVLADRERVSQVLINLINNAVKYSPKGEKVIVSCKKENNMVTISIEDFGIGISDEEREKIFGRFYQANSDGKTFAGLGLGLYISKEIVERHGGKIGIETKEGKGTKFFFTLGTK